MIAPVRISLSVLAFAAGLASVGSALAQAPAAPAGPPPAPVPATAPTAVTTPTASIAGMQIKQVTPNTYMVTGGGGNATVRVGVDGIVLVDTKNAGSAFYNDLISRIRWVSTLPVRTVIITHQHGDHSGNIGLFTAQKVPVIATTDLKTRIEALPTPANGVRLAPPSVTYDGRAYPVLNGYGQIEAYAYHFAPAHTGGDTVVYFPYAKVVSMGDELVNNGITPNIDGVQGGTAQGYSDSLAETLKLDWEYAIPGHGDNPMTKAEVAAYKQKWDTFIARGKAAVKSGVTKDKLMASIKTDDLGWNVNTPLWNTPARVDLLFAEFSK